MSYQDFPANILARSSLLVNMSELSEVPEKSILESLALPFKYCPADQPGTHRQQGPGGQLREEDGQG